MATEMFRKLDFKKIIPFFILLVAIIALVEFEERQNQAIDIPNNDLSNYTLDYVQLRKFTSQLKTEDPKIVYNQLTHDTANIPFLTRHNLAHIFGKALYMAKGASGIPICDSNLSFGCYHGLFSEAIATEGIDIVPVLDRSCEEAGQSLYTGCQHGIGHGLVEYYGRNKIAEALVQCKKIQKNLLVGCSSGVFMEYFVPNPPTEESKQIKLADDNDPFKPCRPIEASFVNSCIHEIPRLWRTTSTDFNKFRKNCLRLNHPDQQKSCYRGLGYVTMNTVKPDPNFSLSVCEQMSNEQTKLFCLAGATWGYRTIDKTEITVEAIKSLCTHSYDERECIKLSNLKLDRM